VVRRLSRWPTPTSLPAAGAAATICAMDYSTRRKQSIVMADGRSVCFAQWGDPVGFPVFVLHGTPGGRLQRHPDESRYVEAGAWVITHDRAGYGESDRLPGRSVVDCVGDVAAIADHLGIERFAVSGGSGGGPHSLAVAARLGPRVVRARCVVGVAPYGLPDLDFFRGMDPLNVTEFGWALEGEERLVPELTRELVEMGERVAADPSKLLGDDWALDEADRDVLSRPDMAAMYRESTEDLVRGGVWGWVDDDLAFTKPWGFDLSEIAVPVEVRYGARDVLSPAAHGAWLGRNVPGALVVVEEGEGHMGDPDKVTERMRWLVTGE
jgi:pimeloyl-ACP methyl ester carboxylesterase